MKGKVLSILAVLLMLVSLIPSTASADPIDAVGTQEATDLVAMNPYAAVDPSTYQVTINTTSAQAAGMSSSAIQTALDYAAMNNAIMTHFQNGGTIDTLSPSVFTQFTPFFQRAQSTGLQDIPGINALACGGSFAKPHPVPPRNNSGFFGTKAQVEARLALLGYHQTAGYAGGDGFDWTLVVNAFGCPGGPFRSQARVFQSNGQWTYNTQSPEPNPEIFSYSWPAFWWGPYVAWWHRTF